MIRNPNGCKYQNYQSCGASEVTRDTVYICRANSREAKPVREWNMSQDKPCVSAKDPSSRQLGWVLFGHDFRFLTPCLLWGVSDYICVSIGFEGFKYEAPNTLLCCLPFKSHWSSEGDVETGSQIYALSGCRLESASFRHLVYSVFVIQKYCHALAWNSSFLLVDFARLTVMHLGLF